MFEKRVLAKNTAVMTAASLISQAADVCFDLWLTAKVGAAAMGTFRLVMTVFTMGITFSCAGTRLASSRITAELSARKSSTASAARILFSYAFAVSAAVSALMLGFSPVIAKKWIGSAAVIPAVKVLALTLPVIAFNSVMSGRFTALGLASGYSGILLAEDLFRIASTVFFIKKSKATKSALMLAIACGKGASELFSLSASLLLNSAAKRKEQGRREEKLPLGSLLRIALPDLFGASARSVLLTAEHLLIPRCLQASGATADSALAAYGLIHSAALPMLLLPGALLRSAAELIIPEAARENALGNRSSVNGAAEKLIGMTSVFAIGCGGIMLAFASPAAALAGIPEACGCLRILAPLVPVMFCDITTDALLRGLDCQMTSMKINIADSAICVAFVALLLPAFGIKGYIFTLYFSEIFNFYFSMRKLTRVCSLRFSPVESVIKPCIRVFFACAAFFAVIPRLSASRALTVLAITAAAAGYAVMEIFPKHSKKPEKHKAAEST